MRIAGTTYMSIRTLLRVCIRPIFPALYIYIYHIFLCMCVCMSVHVRMHVTCQQLYAFIFFVFSCIDIWLLRNAVCPNCKAPICASPCSTCCGLEEGGEVDSGAESCTTDASRRSPAAAAGTRAERNHSLFLPSQTINQSVFLSQ